MIQEETHLNNDNVSTMDEPVSAPVAEVPEVPEAPEVPERGVRYFSRFSLAQRYLHGILATTEPQLGLRLSLISMVGT